eukprot:GHVU01102567.1.p4 GENE.GHVU01102567.1~~GHVU01102567.1.p4  ORF type:complete len:101 (-),score=16.63 GHVU01102567.1:582-884(-)
MGSTSPQVQSHTHTHIHTHTHTQQARMAHTFTQYSCKEAHTDYHTPDNRRQTDGTLRRNHTDDETPLIDSNTHTQRETGQEQTFRKRERESARAREKERA